jgi:hypothetical protein
MRPRNSPGLLAVSVACYVIGASQASSDGLRRQEFQTNAAFELIVSSSKVLRPGTTTIMAQSAFVTRTHGLIPGNSDGLELQFFTRPITEAARTDILENGAKELRRSDYAALVLFLDKERRVWQVNLTYVVPGSTVARTVAWKPEELRQFSNYNFDGKRLLLKSKGSYSESGEERLRLSWDVDLRLPVFDRKK